MPKDGQVAVLLGDPTKAEVVVLRVKMPANYQVPPPTHPYAETITVNPPVRISAAVSSIFVAGFFSGR
jgi:hypothetical protein